MPQSSDLSLSFFSHSSSHTGPREQHASVTKALALHFGAYVYRLERPHCQCEQHVSVAEARALLCSAARALLQQRIIWKFKVLPVFVFFSRVMHTVLSKNRLVNNHINIIFDSRIIVFIRVVVTQQ